MKFLLVIITEIVHLILCLPKVMDSIPVIIKLVNQFRVFLMMGTSWLYRKTKHKIDVTVQILAADFGLFWLALEIFKSIISDELSSEIHRQLYELINVECFSHEMFFLSILSYTDWILIYLNYIVEYVKKTIYVFHYWFEELNYIFIVYFLFILITQPYLTVGYFLFICLLHKTAHQLDKYVEKISLYEEWKSIMYELTNCNVWIDVWSCLWFFGEKFTSSY